MPHLIRKLEGDKQILLDRIAEDAEVLLRSLDLTKIFEVPDYLETISLEFVEQLMAEIAAGILAGEAFAKAVIDEKNGRDHGN